MKQETTTPITIIGAGLAGLHTAYELEQRGFTNISIYELNAIGSGASSRNTGKVSIQQGILLQSLSNKNAQIFIQAQQNALQKLTKLIKQNSLECNYQECDSEIQSNNVDAIAKECDCYQNLDINYQQTSPASVAIHQQYSYNPKLFMQEFPKLLKHTKIYENTPIRSIKKVEDGYLLITPKKEIQTNVIIVCTNYPILYKPFSLYLTQIGQYMITTQTPKTKTSYTLQIEDPKLSFNQISVLNRFTCYGERVGKKHHEETIIKAYENSFTTPIETIDYLQDCITPDGLPICGSIPSYPNCYVITGFNKWGNLNSLVCARIIANLLTQSQEEINSLFDCSRFSLYNAKFIKENARTIAALLNRQAQAYCYIDGTPYATYQKEGKTHLVSLVCPHLKGILRYNEETRCFECPVHGSVFKHNGTLIHSPATTNLATKIEPNASKE